MSEMKGILQKLNESQVGEGARARHQTVMRSLTEAGDVVSVMKAAGFSLSYSEHPYYYFSPKPGVLPLAAYKKAMKALDRARIDYSEVGNAGGKYEGDVEVVLEESVQLLDEGIYDPYILKAIFLAGGGGSGKGFISSLMFGTVNDMATTSHGLKSVNSDDLVTALTGNLPIQKGTGQGGRGRFPTKPTVGLGGRAHAELTQDYFGTEQGKETRKTAKRLIQARQRGFIGGRLGLIVDGTGAKPVEIGNQKKRLEDLGYDCSMVLVNTEVEVAVQRNAMRRRNVPEDVLRDDHAAVQRAIPLYKVMFGNYTFLTQEKLRSLKVPGFIEVDNSVSISPKEVKNRLSPLLWKVAKKILEAPLQNPLGYEWLESQVAHLDPSARSKVTWLKGKMAKRDVGGDEG